MDGADLSGAKAQLLAMQGTCLAGALTWWPLRVGDRETHWLPNQGGPPDEGSKYIPDVQHSGCLHLCMD